MIELYGIRNCDTVKKARKWLDDNALEYQFHDFKKDGLNTEKLDQWVQAIGWETLLNRRSTTWRKLPENVRENMDASAARQVMLDNPSIIKRPVTEHQGQVTVGFNAANWTTEFLEQTPT